MEHAELRGLKLINGSEILDVKPEQFIMLSDEGDPFTMRNTPYNVERIIMNGDRRIHHWFDEENHLQETYDQRIINCTYRGRLFQTRPEFSDGICLAIRRDRERDPGAVTAYQEIVARAERETPMYDILDMFTRQMTGVTRTKEGYWVQDGRFLVTLRGNTDIYTDGKRTGGLCLVMRTTGTRGLLPGPKGGVVRANDLTLTIISKIFYLLRPDLTDRVFVQQCPPPLRAYLRAREEALRRSEETEAGHATQGSAAAPPRAPEKRAAARPSRKKPALAACKVPAKKPGRRRAPRAGRSA